KKSGASSPHKKEDHVVEHDDPFLLDFGYNTKNMNPQDHDDDDVIDNCEDVDHDADDAAKTPKSTLTDQSESQGSSTIPFDISPRELHLAAAREFAALQRKKKWSLEQQ
ncbi:unnamed protein product, partial [Amoebophrya sp. A120]